MEQMLGWWDDASLLLAPSRKLQYRSVGHRSIRLCALALYPASKAKKLPWVNGNAPSLIASFDQSGKTQ